MKKHRQTQFHSEQSTGNCWVTALACLLDLEQIPESAIDIHSPQWWDQSQDLANKYGRTLIEFPWNGGRFATTPCIISGQSPRGNFKHSVLGEIFSNDDTAAVAFLHDPHPSDAFVTTVEYITIAVPITPPNPAASSRDPSA